MRQVEENSAGEMGELTMVESVLKENVSCNYVFRYSKEQLKDTLSRKEDKARIHKNDSVFQQCAFYMSSPGINK